MALNLENLDEKTRKLMLEEVSRDTSQNKLYLSPRLNNEGKQRYANLLKKAINEGNDTSLAREIIGFKCLNDTESSTTKLGKAINKNVPKNAHETLAEGEFNRFYVRALCLRVIEECLTLEVYRAKDVSNPRVDSESKIGKKIEDPNKLLEDLRRNVGIEPALGIPPGPNSGISVRIKNEK